MNMKTILAVGLAVVLPGCNDEPAPQPSAAETQTSNQQSGDIAQLTDGQRNAVFIRAIRDAGRECQQVEGSKARAPVNNAPAWTATCESGTEWIIIPFGDGEAQVLSPAELEAAGSAGNTAR